MRSTIGTDRAAVNYVRKALTYKRKDPWKVSFQRDDPFVSIKYGPPPHPTRAQSHFNWGSAKRQKTADSHPGVGLKLRRLGA
jgi:hypothetical protein